MTVAGNQDANPYLPHEGEQTSTAGLSHLTLA